MPQCKARCPRSVPRGTPAGSATPLAVSAARRRAGRPRGTVGRRGRGRTASPPTSPTGPTRRFSSRPPCTRARSCRRLHGQEKKRDTPGQRHVHTSSPGRETIEKAWRRLAPTVLDGAREDGESGEGGDGGVHGRKAWMVGKGCGDLTGYLRNR